MYTSAATAALMPAQRPRQDPERYCQGEKHEEPVRHGDKGDLFDVDSGKAETIPDCS
jgi:hypothetical protein